MSTAWWSHPVHLAILDRYRITGRICSVIQPWSARWSAVRACWCQCDLHILICMQHAYSQRERFHMCFVYVHQRYPIHPFILSVSVKFSIAFKIE
jgi:hypothetical protein